MSSLKVLVLGVLSLSLLVGCGQPGMNIKKGSTDAGAGVAVVGTLEAVPVEHFENTKVKIIKVSTELLNFVESGQLSKLPLDEVEDRLVNFMISKGYDEYTYLVDAALQYVKSQSLDVGTIGKNNIDLITIYLTETIRNAQRCTLEGRTNWKQEKRKLNQ